MVSHDVTMKHRTQLLLEERHYAYLKREASVRRCSLSSALRDLLEERMSRSALPMEEDPVLQIAGKYDGPAGAEGRNAEEILYGR